jgi:hypothetical protein
LGRLQSVKARITAVIAKELRLSKNRSVLVENEEAEPKGSDLGGLLADLLEGAPPTEPVSHSLVAYERTWKAFLAWAAAASLDPRGLSFPAALEAPIGS